MTALGQGDTGGAYSVHGWHNLSNRKVALDYNTKDKKNKYPILISILIKINVHINANY